MGAKERRANILGPVAEAETGEQPNRSHLMLPALRFKIMAAVDRPLMIYLHGSFPYESRRESTSYLVAEAAEPSNNFVETEPPLQHTKFIFLSSFSNLSQWLSFAYFHSHFLLYHSRSDPRIQRFHGLVLGGTRGRPRPGRPPSTYQLKCHSSCR